MSLKTYLEALDHCLMHHSNYSGYPVARSGPEFKFAKLANKKDLCTHDVARAIHLNRLGGDLDHLLGNQRDTQFYLAGIMSAFFSEQ